MIDLKDLQKQIMDNRREKGFSSDVTHDFCRAYEELSEAFSKFSKGDDGVAEEFADVVIFLLGMCDQLGFDLEKELVSKVAKNKRRQYKKVVASNGKEVFLRIKTDEDP